MSTSVDQSSIASSVPISEPVLVPEMTGKVSTPSFWRTTLSAPTVNAPLAPPPLRTRPMRGGMASSPDQEVADAEMDPLDEHGFHGLRRAILGPAMLGDRLGEHLLAEEVGALRDQGRHRAPGGDQVGAAARGGDPGVEGPERLAVATAIEQAHERIGAVALDDGHGVDIGHERLWRRAAADGGKEHELRQRDERMQATAITHDGPRGSRVERGTGITTDGSGHPPRSAADGLRVG